MHASYHIYRPKEIISLSITNSSASRRGISLGTPGGADARGALPLAPFRGRRHPRGVPLEQRSIPACLAALPWSSVQTVALTIRAWLPRRSATLPGGRSIEGAWGSMDTARAQGQAAQPRYMRQTRDVRSAHSLSCGPCVSREMLRNRVSAVQLTMPCTVHMATPQGQPWTPAVTLPQGRNGLRARRMAVWWTCRAPSLGRHVHRE